MSVSARFLLLSSLGILASCQQTAVRPAGSTLEEQPEPRADQPADAETESEPELPIPDGRDVSFEKELAQVAQIRGLNPKGPISGRLVEPDELINHVKRAVALETPPRALKGTEVMLVGLGVVPFEFNYEKSMLELLSENLQGLYDPHLKMMLMRSNLSTNYEPTLMHELVHALQDQYFDLDEIVEWQEDDTDRSSALSCLAEGDATSSMFDGMMKGQGTALDLPPERFRQLFGAIGSTAPPIIRRSLAAPYLDGLEFVHALRRRKGWEEVNRIWENPPTTTEQILHVDKYDAREAAVSVPVPGAPSKEWEVVLHDIWGEQSLRLVLEEWVPQTKAIAAAAGWGGDRIVVHKNGAELAVTWDIVMDSEEDAKELEAAALTAGEPAGDTPKKGASSNACINFGPDDPRVLSVSRMGNRVRLSSGSFDRKSARKSDCSEAQGWHQTPEH